MLSNSVCAVLVICMAFLLEEPARAEDQPSEAARAQAFSQGLQALKLIPIQDGGRIKPLDTFAREALTLVYGSATYKSQKPQAAGEEASSAKKGSGPRSAIEVVFTWFLAPQFWDVQPIVEVKLRALKEALKLDMERDRFSPNEIIASDRIGLVLQDLAGLRASKQKLDGYYQAVQRLENQLGLYQSIKSGQAFRLLPPTLEQMAQKPAIESMATGQTGSGEREKWLSIMEAEPEIRESFSQLARAFIRNLPGVDASAAMASDASSSSSALKDSVAQFQTLARARNAAVYPGERDLKIEVHYSELHPFRWSWVLYVFGAVLIAVAWQQGRSKAVGVWSERLAWTSVILAFLLHTYGFALRVYLTGRPPVSNMYESVVWVSWGVVLFALIFAAKLKMQAVLLSGAAVAGLCNIVADSAPHILDATLQPLEPVLRSNLWLTVHVLTIVISYSAFFLAWGLGNLGLGQVALAGRVTGSVKDKVDDLAKAAYRAMQVGVVLLAAGTILGGVWADYSWGRFWGWDPKETWALIALLGYIALLHARLSGIVRELGMLAGSVVAFSLVMMAWYGVNYVLGAGLHSYGFGAGGVEYVSAFVFLNFIFVGYALSRAQNRTA